MFGVVFTGKKVVFTGFFVSLFLVGFTVLMPCINHFFMYFA